jgi:hypothetical protein
MLGRQTFRFSRLIAERSAIDTIEKLQEQLQAERLIHEEQMESLSRELMQARLEIFQLKVELAKRDGFDAGAPRFQFH